MRCFCLLLLVAVLSACEQTATPYPVDVATATIAPAALAADAVIRYALAPNIGDTHPFRGEADSRLEIIHLTEPVSLEDLGPRYDIIVAYGAYADAVPSPTLINYALLVNTALSPLDKPEITAIILQALDPEALAATLEIPDIRVTPRDHETAVVLQAALANAGWPDGFDLSFGHDSPLLAVDGLRAQFQALNIRLNSQPLNREFATYHLVLVTWTTLRERETWAALSASGEHMIDLFAVPISYWAIEGLELVFGPQGWPFPVLE